MAATLVIGLGGTGCNVVREVAWRAQQEGVSDVEFLVMDTDVNALKALADENPAIRIIQTSPRGTVGAALDSNHFASDYWFPLNEGLMGKSFSEGAGQVRAISRLALDISIGEGKMRPLEEAIETLRGLSGDTLHQEMRIMICGSLAGGTGSGILLPVGMYVRNYLQTRYQDHSAIIRGLFLEPDTFFDVIDDEGERNSLRANAYAAVRELDAFFRKQHMGELEGYRGIVFNAPRPGSGERMDYPSVLPYNFVFLLDAINEEGEHLPTKADYEHHAADILFAQALSPISSPSNSKEDNVIKKQVESNGRSRYCGAGFSALVYPSEVIQRYIALRWALKSTSEYWTYLDRGYRNEQSEGVVDRTLAEFYTAAFRQHRDSQDFPFILNASKGTQFKMRDKDSAGNIVEVKVEQAPSFTAEVLGYAQRWAESELPAASADLAAATASGRFSRLPKGEDALAKIIDRYKGDKAKLGTTLSNDFGTYFNDLKAYANALASSAEQAANAAFSLTYKVPEYDDPFSAHRNRWQFESIISEDGGNTAVHPAGVRYLLYTCMECHRERLEELEKECKSLWRDVEKVIGDKSDFDPNQPGEQTIGEAIAGILAAKEDERGLKKLILRFVNDKDSDEIKSQLLIIIERLRKTYMRLDSWRLATVQASALRASLSYMRSLTEAYESFFASLEDKITAIDIEIESIERSPLYNTHRGRTRRYVCADIHSLQRTFEDCQRNGQEGELPGDLSAQLYRELLAVSGKQGFNLPKDGLMGWKNRRYDDAFENVIMQYWIKEVGSKSNPNSRVVTRDVIEALIKEATYANEGKTTTKDELERANAAYIEDVFAAVNHLATPFIEKPESSSVREIAVCAYNEGIFASSGAYRDLLHKLLEESGGTSSDDESLRQQILFYRSVYGFCSTDLPKYAPARGVHENHPAGEYHSVYWRLVNQLSPNLAANKVVTPHINRDWHLVTFLPDINDEYEGRVVNDTCTAFLYGLLWREFGNRGNDESGPVFVLRRKQGTKNSSRYDRARACDVDLLVTNHSLCDHFYEVYDALSYNPLLVSELLERYELTLRREKDRTVAPSVERCDLISQLLGSEEVFSNFDPLLYRLKARVYARIEIAKKEYDKVERRDIRVHSKNLVCNLFKEDFDDEKDLLKEYICELNPSMSDDEIQSITKNRMRISIFTIPLLYRISLIHGVRREIEINNMIDGVFSFVRAYLANFCDEHDLDRCCDRLFAEQYLVFEENVAWLETYVSGIHANKTVNEIRENIESRYETSADNSLREVGKLKLMIEDRWKR